MKGRGFKPEVIVKAPVVAALCLGAIVSDVFGLWGLFGKHLENLAYRIDHGIAPDPFKPSK